MLTLLTICALCIMSICNFSISRLVLRAGYGFRLHQFLVIDHFLLLDFYLSQVHYLKRNVNPLMPSRSGIAKKVFRQHINN